MGVEKKIILFDGVCNLCNSSIQFVIKRDKDDLFRYAALQSKIGQKLISERNIDTKNLDSIILIEPGIAYYTKSDAALQVGKSLKDKIVRNSKYIQNTLTTTVKFNHNENNFGGCMVKGIVD